MGKTLFITGTLLVAILLVLGACGPSATTTPTSPTEPTSEPGAPEKINLDLWVTVPYWTEGNVYLGVGDNPTYLKLEKVNEVTYEGTVELEEGTEYYFSRGSLSTESTTSYRTTDLPRGLHAVVDWVDSDKEIALPEFQKGVIFGGMLWRPEELAIPGIIEYNLDMAKQSGVEWLGLVNTWYAFPDARNPQEMKPFYATDGEYPDTQGWSTPTLTDEQMKDIIAKARERGFKIFLKPTVVSFGYGPERPWGLHYEPDSWDLWFSEYTQCAVHFAQLAEETNVELYAIGTELDLSSIEELADFGAPPDATQRWRDLIEEVRKYYSGKITLSVACVINPEKWEEFPCHAPGRIKFWDELDYIGFEPYFPWTQSNDPSLSEMNAAFGDKLDSVACTMAKQLYDEYGKPVIFTEYSFHSYDGANRYQLYTPPSPVVDLQEQADMHEAMMQVIEERPWIQGAYPWAWYLVRPDDNLEWQLQDTDGPFIGKPAGQVLKKWYLKIED